MLRRLHHEQPDSFAFTDANLEWAKSQISKFPEGRQASAVIPLLWRAQEQEGWVSRPAIETVAELLGLAKIRVLEVASFYFMFQLAPVGKIHVQICGTTSCMICGAEDLIAVCKERIGPKAHTPYQDGMFSWEEVECLGACSNAPMAQIGKDFYEDLTTESFAGLLDAFARGEVPTPGPQNGRYASEPKSGLTSLKIPDDERNSRNASVQLAVALGETVARIDGTEAVASAAIINSDAGASTAARKADAPKAADAPPPPQPDEYEAYDETSRPEASEEMEAMQPAALASAIEGKPDDLKKISGIGPVLEGKLNEIGVFHYAQIAAWSDAEMAWIEREIVSFSGRSDRDDWRGQAARLDDEAKAEHTPDHGGDDGDGGGGN